MSKVIDNDYHPNDKGLEAKQEDHWGTVKSDTLYQPKLQSIQRPEIRHPYKPSGDRPEPK